MTVLRKVPESDACRVQLTQSAGGGVFLVKYLNSLIFVCFALLASDCESASPIRLIWSGCNTWLGAKISVAGTKD